MNTLIKKAGNDSFLLGFAFGVVLMIIAAYGFSCVMNSGIEQPKFSEWSGIRIESRKEADLHEAYRIGWLYGIDWARDRIYNDSTRHIAINQEWEFKKWYENDFLNK